MQASQPMTPFEETRLKITLKRAFPDISIEEELMKPDSPVKRDLYNYYFMVELQKKINEYLIAFAIQYQKMLDAMGVKPQAASSFRYGEVPRAQTLELPLPIGPGVDPTALGLMQELAGLFKKLFDASKALRTLTERRAELIREEHGLIVETAATVVDAVNNHIFELPEGPAIIQMDPDNMRAAQERYLQHYARYVPAAPALEPAAPTAAQPAPAAPPLDPNLAFLDDMHKEFCRDLMAHQFITMVNPTAPLIEQNDTTLALISAALRLHLTPAYDYLTKTIANIRAEHSEVDTKSSELSGAISDLQQNIGERETALRNLTRNRPLPSAPGLADLDKPDQSSDRAPKFVPPPKK